MQTVKAFLKLVRWPNLAFIFLTQCLFYYIVFGSITQLPPAKHFLFGLLVVASVFIAAAGYIINDYFDLHIDVLNKPQKVVIDRKIKRRWAIVLHLVFSAIGLALSFYISYRTKVLIIGPANLVVVVLLWFYSTHFKRQVLIGNIVIALLTAWIIVVVYFFTGADFLQRTPSPFNEPKLFKLMIMYAGFAFITTLIREAIKDLEDMRGDAALHCETMPIAWGVAATKVYIGVWLVVTISAIIIILIYALQLGWWPVLLYAIPLVIYPLIGLFRRLKPTETFKEYHSLSSQIKRVMLAGILSMVFFLFLK